MFIVCNHRYTFGGGDEAEKSAATRARLATKSEVEFREDISNFLDEGVAHSDAGHGTETLGEIALWRAVITQALMDAGSESKKSEMKFERAQAISWLSGISPDFSAICLMAGFEPAYIRKKAKEAIARGCVWRKDELRQMKRQKRIQKIQKIESAVRSVIKERKSIIG